MIFGTSRHLSVGTFAIISLMVYSTINKLEEQLSPGLALTQNMNETLNSTIDITDQTMIRVRIATSLAFWSGIVQVTCCFFFLFRNIK
jgi:sulfate anion transporter 6